jgi:hypothetical protein
MKITFDTEKAFSLVLIFVLGAGFFMGLPVFEKTTTFVKLGTVTMTAAPAEAVSEFKTPAMINVPVTWSAPFIGSCYLTIDVRPQGAPKGEPETPEWDQNHLIRAKFDSRWWVQKWINVYVLQQRQGSEELRFAIADPNAPSLDIYTELKCDDNVLSEGKATITYKV